MFGESDDENSPYIGSPWDSILSSSPSVEAENELKRRLQSSTRLMPEVEEVRARHCVVLTGLSSLATSLTQTPAAQGNVEYKLKLINPTPERFARAY